MNKTIATLVMLIVAVIFAPNMHQNLSGKQHDCIIDYKFFLNSIY